MRDKRQEAGDKRQETRFKIQETRNKKQETRNKKQERKMLNFVFTVPSCHPDWSASVTEGSFDINTAGGKERQETRDKRQETRDKNV